MKKLDKDKVILFKVGGVILHYFTYKMKMVNLCLLNLLNVQFIYLHIHVRHIKTFFHQFLNQ